MSASEVERDFRIFEELREGVLTVVLCCALFLLL